MDSRAGSFPSLCVVGAGVVGLTSAIQLQQEFPLSSVTIIADKFNSDTTSFGAAGLFRPMLYKLSGTSSSDFRNWTRDSWRFFSSLANSKDASAAGCQVVVGYEFLNKQHDAVGLQEHVYSREPVSAKEREMFNESGSSGKRHAFRIVTTLASPVRLLSYLMTEFKNRGGRVVEKHLHSLQELAGKYDVVVNCCGLGAKQLINDKLMTPIRGQVIRVKAPWITMFYFAENDDGSYVYVIPVPDFVIVGGCKQVGDDDVTFRQSDHDDIWRRACKLFPSLERATQLGDWVGLRPARSPLRVEAEVMQFPVGKLRVVHNYGHGSDGIALSYGTSAHAVRLVKQILQQNPISGSSKL